MNLHPLNVIAQQLRAAALAADDATHDLRELCFRRWSQETVYPAAIDRWLLAVAEASR